MEQLPFIALWVLAIFLVTSFSAYLGKKYGIEFIIATVAILIVVANAIANKIIVIGSLTMTASVVVYAMIFLMTDLIAEVWGKKQAQKAVWIGFYGVVVFVIAGQIAIHWDPAPFALAVSESFQDVFGTSVRIAIGSMLAYLISQHYDVIAYSYLKEVTNGKHMWLRNNLSTISSQFISTIIFISIAFYGILPLLPLILGQWIVKSVIALLDTPFLYLMTHIVRSSKIS